MVGAIFFTLVILMINESSVENINLKYAQISSLSEKEEDDFTTKTLKPLDKSPYYENSQWMYNGNSMQYSSYIIVENENKLKIESNIFLNKETDNLICFIRLLRYEKTLRLNLVEIFPTSSRIAHKIECGLNLNESKYKFKLDEIGFAVIIDDEYSVKEESGRFSYELINYQIPEIIKISEPRLPEVGLCVNYVSHIYNGIYSWIELNRQFKFAEIVLHDGSSERKLKSLFQNKFDSQFLHISDYNLTYEEICQSNQIKFLMSKVQNIPASYMEVCNNFHTNWFASINSYDNHHNHVSPNDCYSRLSYKYEFVALFDLDELIIPRTYDPLNMIKSKEIFKCEKNSKLCDLNPILSTSMYTYLKKIIQDNFEYDITKLRSIGFLHGAYLIPNDVEKNVMNTIKDIALKIESNTLTGPFPIQVNFGFVLEINENDKDYVVYLNKLYNEFTCYYNKYLSNITNFDKNFIRYLYFMTGSDIRLPKSIHYTKNVYTLFTHDARTFHNESFILYPPWNQSHINSHFRGDIQTFLWNGRASITKFSFDFEYAYFLLKNYSDFCKL